LILRKIIKIVATRCPIFRLKCTKFDFGWGSAPDPLAGFKGPTSKGREGRKGRGRKWRNWEGSEGGEGVGAPFNVLPPGTTDLVAPLLGYFILPHPVILLCGPVLW